MLKIRNFITLYVITILYVVRALQTKFPSGMLPVGIEPTDPLSYTTPSCVAL